MVLAAQAGGLPAVFGMTIFAAVVELGAASLLRRLRILFPPAISGLIVMIVGIQLGLVAIDSLLGIEVTSVQKYVPHLIVAGIALVATIGLAVWSSGMARMMCSMIGMLIGLAAALAFSIISADAWQALDQAQIIALPSVGHLSYEFDASLIPIFLVAAVAATLRTVGVITTCQKINDDDWRHPDLSSIRGGIYADGLGCLLGGLMGTMGMNTGPSLVGVSKASGATSRVIAFATGGILILFALSPKIGALFILLPNAVGGGTLLFTASFMIAGGIQIMVSRNIDTRMTFVIGVPIVLGLAREVFQDYFKKLPLVLHPITNSMLSIAVVSTLLLHLVFRLGSKRTAGVTVDDLARPQDEMTALLKEQGQIWNIDAHVIQRAVETTRQVLDHIERAHLVGADLRAQISYDDFRFIVTITYSGTLLNLPNGGVRHRSFLEEESFSYGLADFLTGVYPDHMEAKSHGGKVEIRLFFST